MSKPIYDHQNIEEKWLQAWEDQALFQDSAKGNIVDPLYLLFAFAYPSGSGLHVGHVESKTALDILARYSRMQGRSVFFPVGWDAFGLPAENYAIKTGVPPAETTKQAINTFRRQIKRVGISYDWVNELATSHPEYYRWTQWIFAELYKAGLAYQAEGKVNWCPSCQTVLANEQVVDGACERCGTPVEQKNLKQWYFKITQYKDELVSGLDQVDWPKPTKQQQLNWIGKKTGINIAYDVADQDQTITCFTTRPDTNFGATFIVIAPEHDLVEKITSGELISDEADVEAISAYVKKASEKSELDRQMEGRTKTGVFTGLYAVNNLTGENMPIWISDFVLAGFGTGAVVGVPGHDLRDFQFATTFDIPVKRVVIGPDQDTSEITDESQVQEDAGIMVNSEFLDGLEIMEAKDKIMDYLEEKGWGERVTTYRLRDWLISRQRYWGVPIPVIYDPDGQAHLVEDMALPWTLPTDVDFKPTGESPLTSSEEFQARTEAYAAKHHADLIAEKGWDKSGKGWRPEYDTMDTFVDSSWYFLRYVDSRNKDVFADQSQIEKWLPVDFYMIGPEHIVLHLLYSRFFTKFLRDQGYVKFDEPFMKMRHQGMILGPDHRKMSKSKGNVVNPDDVISKFGADTLRVYEMFMGPIEADKPWDISAVAGVYRFLRRVHDVFSAEISKESESLNGEVRQKFHQTLDKVSSDIPALKFNTAIAAMMEFLNEWESASRKQAGRVMLPEENLAVAQMIAPFAPFLADELYHRVSEKAEKQASDSVHLSTWPVADSELAQASKVIIPVQVNGKVRAQLEVSAEQATSEEYVVTQAKELEAIESWLADKTIRKVIFVPGKILNFVV